MAERTCARCGTASGRRKWCSDRCRKRAKHGLADVQTWTCIGCGAHCERPPVRGQVPKWCADCRARGLREPSFDRTCEWCGRRGIKPGSRYCSWRCVHPLALPLPATVLAERRAKQAQQRRADALARLHAPQSPANRTWINGRCQRCGDEFTTYSTNPDVLTPHCSRRCAKGDANAIARAESYGVHVEPVNRWRVFADHGSQCHICNEPIDMTLDRNDPDCPSVDHVIPLALGGPHTQDNLRPAHMRCNSLKGIDEAGTPY